MASSLKYHKLSFLKSPLWHGASCKRVLAFAVLICLLFASNSHADRAMTVVDNVGSAETERRIALVIGNANYKSSPLRNPINDAEDISAALKRLGFEVSLGKDMTRKQMRSAIRKFGNDLKRGGVGLFYYAGHGMQVEGRNFLIPLGADINADDEVQDEAVDAGSVLRKMESAGNPMNMVFLDACRDNPFSRSFRSASKGLAKMEAPKGSLLVYSTGPGNVAADGTGRNGIYTKNLLAKMETPRLELSRLLRQVRADVMQETNDRQTPWESTSRVGDFYFVQEPTTGDGPIPPPPPPPVSPKGHLQVNVNAKSSVKVNGDPQGIATPGHPFNIQNLPTGNVTVLVEAKGYESQERTVAINQNEWSQEVFSLQRETVGIPAAPQQDNGRTFSASDKGKTYPVSGRFSTTYGIVTFHSSGPRAADYPNDSGRLFGNYSDSVLSGYWVETKAARKCSTPKDGTLYWGKIRFTFDFYFNEYHGVWGYCDDEPKSKWNGKRTGQKLSKSVKKGKPEIQANITPLGFEEGIDRPGSDFENFNLSDAQPSLCRDACSQEELCKAWTYVKPGVQGTQARCWLKGTIPMARENNCCVSGVKGNSQDSSTSGLLGSWICQDGKDTISLVFPSGNQIIFDGEPEEISISSGVIRSEGQSFPYHLQGDRLTLTNPEENETLHCQRGEGVIAGRPGISGFPEGPNQSGHPGWLQRGFQKGNQGRRADNHNHLLRGTFCSYTSSRLNSKYSGTTKVTYDGKGHFALGSSSTFVFGNQGSGYAQGGGLRGTYQVRGNQVRFQTNDGNRGVAIVHNRSGVFITELKYGNQLYAMALCE